MTNTISIYPAAWRLVHDVDEHVGHVTLPHKNNTQTVEKSVRAGMRI